MHRSLHRREKQAIAEHVSNVSQDVQKSIDRWCYSRLCVGMAVKGKIFGRKQLEQVGTLFTRDTILRWHRQLVANKWDCSGRISGALSNLGYNICDTTIGNILTRQRDRNDGAARRIASIISPRGLRAIICRSVKMSISNNRRRDCCAHPETWPVFRASLSKAGFRFDRVLASVIQRGTVNCRPKCSILFFDHTGLRHLT